MGEKGHQGDLTRGPGSEDRGSTEENLSQYQPTKRMKHEQERASQRSSTLKNTLEEIHDPQHCTMKDNPQQSGLNRELNEDETKIFNCQPKGLIVTEPLALSESLIGSRASSLVHAEILPNFTSITMGSHCVTEPEGDEGQGGAQAVLDTEPGEPFDNSITGVQVPDEIELLTSKIQGTESVICHQAWFNIQLFAVHLV